MSQQRYRLKGNGETFSFSHFSSLFHFRYAFHHANLRDVSNDRPKEGSGTYSNGLAHVADGEASQGGVVREGFDAPTDIISGGRENEGAMLSPKPSGIAAILGRRYGRNTYIGLLGTSLTIEASPLFRLLGLSSTDLPVRRSRLVSANTVNVKVGYHTNLRKELGELASDMGGVAVEDGGIAGADLAGVIQDNDLGGEGLGAFGRIVLGVSGDIA